ncbi:hypothetical protein [Halolamina sp.]|jgi:hypothetical protein|uniref:hypothetical protein n=1 Tax=Halolamina sp. TaxID=1940283 RepID=UPI0035685360
MSSSRSDGDSRVLFVLNLLLSFVFSYVVVWGLAFIGVGTFTLQNVALATIALMVLTYLTVLR